MTAEDSSERVGFIGLGIMGSGMARNLLDAGFDLTVWNRTPTKSDSLHQHGAKVASSPADLARRVGIVITCISDTEDVLEIVHGRNGVAAGAVEGSVLIDMSTISPMATIEMAKRLQQNGVHMLDAPVSGGSEGAARGTLSIMVGGEAHQFERVLPVLRAMGSNVTHMGPIGSGQKAKLVNQILVVINMWAVSEALLFAQAAGLDLDQTIEALSGGAAGSWMFKHRGPQCVARDWRPGFTIDLQQKDLRLVLEAADEFGVPTLGTHTCYQLYRALQKQGRGAEGNHALVKAFESLAGFRLGDAPQSS